MKTPEKVCFNCKELKPISEFCKAKQNKDGYSGRCKACDKKYREAFYADKPSHYKKEETLKRVYGLTWSEYQEMLKVSGNCCYVCGAHESRFKKGLSVDHDHSTGQIRGLLCGVCNRFIVARHKTGDLLRKAADYLDTDRPVRVVPDAYKTGVRRKRKKLRNGNS